jgi:protein-disulfide isomerase
MGLKLGAPFPPHTLSDTDGERHDVGDPDGGPASVVVFTCNHCPYALAWHERLMDAGRDYGARGVRFHAVNPNDAKRYPRDSYEAMQARMAKEGDSWSMPYLHDADQDVARDYGARTTPDVFVFDGEGRLVYRGAPDADYEDPSLNAAWLREALDDVLAGRPVGRPQTEPVGCSVKWKP